jgi:hypothetical protein
MYQGVFVFIIFICKRSTVRKIAKALKKDQVRRNGFQEFNAVYK